MITHKILTISLLALTTFGCATTTKIVKVPVPISCPKPVMPMPPVDYMAALNTQSSPTDFVKACLATREAYKTGYYNCVKTLEVYK